MNEIIQAPCSCTDDRIPVGAIGADMSGLTNKVFCHVEGNNLRIFNEVYPGFTGTIHINYCPLCGKRLEVKREVI